MEQTNTLIETNTQFVALISCGEICADCIKDIFFIFPANGENIRELQQREKTRQELFNKLRYAYGIGFMALTEPFQLENILDRKRPYEIIEPTKGLNTPKKVYTDLINDSETWGDFFETL